ncbi:MULTISPECIES: LPS-assembly protein LptD [unclassified Roseitalea]|uniref:LPS-assembly protein LptD n=1 Tax=unclassified Roseitalea TaxID=2639107 RepID=UPI00273E81EA|nr:MULTISPECIES: LPS-assembly protein LptD [unclassified Roseitalea]
MRDLGGNSAQPRNAASCTGLSRLLAATLTAGVCAFALLAAPAAAQTPEALAELGAPNPDAQLLLQADELIYDNDRRIISAVGDVRIDYDGSLLAADRVSYIEPTGRLVAVGRVEILQPGGTRLFAEEIDITDDFRDGFINALRVVTTDNTRFAAESAERRSGTVTIFNNGLYTACEPCAERPDKPPIWQIKAQRIIWNGEEKTVRFENASFEFFGVPIARVPVFTTADPTVRRKSGFLAPEFSFADPLGFGVSVPYFLVTSPSSDLTLTGTGYTRQGFMGQAEFRKRLDNGRFNLKIAGIHQFDPGAFDPGTVDRMARNRGMVATSGQFDINPRWQWGWNGLLQSDKNFARTYAIEGYDDEVVTNEIYLTGLSGRNFFDARAMSFTVQENVPDPAGRDDSQPVVLPSVDYGYIVSQPVAGGELSFDVNTRAIWRDATDMRAMPGLATDDNYATFGIDGQNWRMTAESEWRRTLVAPGGLAVTPILHARGEAFGLNASAMGALSETMEDAGAALAADGTYWRGMATAGVEARWPLLVTAPGSTHVIEPVAQVFLRPDAPGNGVLPNEDAQSLVFDAASLFERDKFSGYDRIEGGHRANIGLRYSGEFAGGFSATGIFGQSIHLGGQNPYARADTTNTGAESGLETDRSDYVGSFGVRHENGFAAGVGARFDETDLALRRAEADISFSTEAVRLAANYAVIKAQPTYGFASDRKEVSAKAQLRFAEYWSVLGAANYDLTNSRFDEQAIGLAYDDECFSFLVAYSEDRDETNAINRSIGFKLTARTLGDLGGTPRTLDF